MIVWEGLLAIAVVALVVIAVGVWRKVADGRIKLVSAGEGEVELGEVEAAQRLDAGTLGAALGARATLVQFSSAFCQPCRATRVILDEVAHMVDGVEHLEIDAEANLDLVRRLDVRRTPTVLILDSTGDIRMRASGQPRKADVIAALGEIIPA